MKADEFYLQTWRSSSPARTLVTAVRETNLPEHTFTPTRPSVKRTWKLFSGASRLWHTQLAPLEWQPLKSQPWADQTFWYTNFHALLKQNSNKQTKLTRISKLKEACILDLVSSSAFKRRHLKSDIFAAPIVWGDCQVSQVFPRGDGQKPDCPRVTDWSQCFQQEV